MTASSPPVPDPRDHREFNLPASAYDVAAVGWTPCDEQRLWTIADHWYAVAEAADSAPVDAAEQAHRAAAEVTAVLGAAAAEAFADAWQAIPVGPDSPPAVLREIGEAMGRLAEGYGRDVEAAKLEAWIELGRLAIELLNDSLSAALALGGPEPVAAGHLAASRVTLHRLFRRLATDLDRTAPAAVLREAGERATRRVTASAPAGPPPGADPTDAAPPPGADPTDALRQGLERRQRDQVARHFLRAARQQRDLARDATEAAAAARRDGLSERAGQLDLLAARAAAGHTELEQRAGAVSDGDPAPAPAGTAAGTSRAGGLRGPLPVHAAALDRAMPRDAAGRIVRRADPRIGEWFAGLNAGGPGTDPTRANNDTDAVLALYETYLFGRPRVASPRTFDGYAAGEPERPVGGEAGGCARIETTTGGRFQGLCPDVGSLAPRDARQAVEHAFTNLHNHLLNCGAGAFAVLAARAEAGGTHLWAAINHDGTLLHLDPQSSILVEGGPPYRHVGREWSGNVVLLDALVVDRHGGYAPLPFHPVGAFGTAAVTGPTPPTGSGPVDPARVLLAEHAARLRHRVAPVILEEVTALAKEIAALTGVVVPVTLRVRSAEAILDEAERSAGNPRAGDVVDTVHVRLVVPDAPTLAVALSHTRLRFPDRIRAVRDADTDRGTRASPSAVHVVVSVRVDGRPYDFALRLVADRVVGVTARPSAPAGRRSHRATRATTGSDVEEMLAEGSR